MTTDLPYGLRPYQPGEFERVHAAGSGILTASSVPALFGHGRFAGRYAIAAHISGRVAMESADNPMTERGSDLEPIVARKLVNRDYQIDRPDLGMYAQHASIANFVASPDAIAWRNEGSHQSAGIVEIKCVAGFIHRDRWADGPPLEVELQHAAQYACCAGAQWGLIAALVIGDVRWELKVYETERNEAAIALIEDAARSLLDMLDAGEMPPPDSHESAARVIMALHPIDPSKEVVLSGEEAKEANEHFDIWQNASMLRLEAEKLEKEHKAWFLAKAMSASRMTIGNGERYVELKDVERKGYTVQPTVYRQIKLKELK